MIAYLLLLTATLLGFLAAPSWTLLAPALGLSALSVRRLMALRERFRRIGRGDVFAWAIAGAAGRNVLFAGAAFALGRAIAHLSGMA
jgi:hypothetical protein